MLRPWPRTRARAARAGGSLSVQLSPVPGKPTVTRRFDDMERRPIDRLAPLLLRFRRRPVVGRFELQVWADSAGWSNSSERADRRRFQRDAESPAPALSGN